MRHTPGRSSRIRSAWGTFSAGGPDSRSDNRAGTHHTWSTGTGRVRVTCHINNAAALLQSGQWLWSHDGWQQGGELSPRRLLMYFYLFNHCTALHSPALFWGFSKCLINTGLVSVGEKLVLSPKAGLVLFKLTQRGRA